MRNVGTQNNSRVIYFQALSCDEADRATCRLIVDHLADIGVTARGLDSSLNDNVGASEARADLAGVDAVVVLWTDDSVISVWVQAEAMSGLQQGRLVSVRLGAAEIPPPFARTVVVEASRVKLTPQEAATVARQIAERVGELGRRSVSASGRAASSSGGEFEFRLLSPRTHSQLSRSVLIAVARTAQGYFAELQNVPELVVVEPTEEEAIASLLELLVGTAADLSSPPPGTFLSPDLVALRTRIQRMVRHDEA